MSFGIINILFFLASKTHLILLRRNELIINKINQSFNKKIIFKKNNKIKEKKYLNLNSNKAKKILKWNCKYDLNMSLKKIVEWEKYYKKDTLKICQNQIKDFLN